MKGFSSQAWVTYALNEDDVSKALIISAAFRRVTTTRSLVAIINSRKISDKSRDILEQSFDFVFSLQPEENLKLHDHDFVKVAAIGLLKPFQKCVFLAPGMLPVRNCDEIFQDDDFQHFKFGTNVTSNIFIFKPSLALFKDLQESLKISMGCDNGHFKMHAFLIKFSETGKNEIFLPKKYNRLISLESEPEIFWNDQDTSIVNFGHLDPNSLDLKNAAPLPAKIALNYWRKLQDDYVLPRLTPKITSDLPEVTADENWSRSNEPIAIVGMSCRFPGANSLSEFWELLIEGRDGTGNPPAFRWLPEQTPTTFNPECRKTNAGFLKCPVDTLDTKFFGVSPKEALFMDPQQRILLQVLWESLENSGIDPLKLRGTSSSVFLGSWLTDYKDMLVHTGNPEFYRAYMGNSIGAMAARISHLLGVTGPAIATESGCSSAMVAVHLAVNSLRLGETNLAMCGGVNLLLYPFEKDALPMVVSPDGHCKTFDESADGFARAEGCGVLILKRFSDAVKDGDRIWALIRGTGVSQEGLSKSMGTPTVHSEALAMTGALKDAGLDKTPEMVSYVEAHGTGTVVGDPLEVAAIAKAYGTVTRKNPLVIGSVKTNVGHTESCSGITGIMKVVLALAKEVIPPHRNFSKLNPAIDLEAVPAVIPLEPLEWKRSQSNVAARIPRLAGVSSFGITGTDAHVIIEEPMESETISNGLSVNDDLCVDPSGLNDLVLKERPWNILKITAKSDEALQDLIESYRMFLRSFDDNDNLDKRLSLSDICYTGNCGRADLPHRAVVIGRSREEMSSNLEQGKFLHNLHEDKGQGTEVTDNEDRPKICFLYPGSGCQFPEMARELYGSSPVFQMHFDLCDRMLREMYLDQIDVKGYLWGQGRCHSETNDYSQIAIFCVEYALTKLWESLGVTPDFVLGHSLGEFAAAVCAGIIGIKDALRLVASRLVEKLPPGKMLAVKGGLSNVTSLLRSTSKFSNLDIAAVNSEDQTVVAGEPQDVTDFALFCRSTGNLKSVELDVSYAFHSRQMDPMIEDYRKICSMIKVKHQRLSKIGYISGATGDLIEDPGTTMDAEYWVKHTRDRVNFLPASRRAVDLGSKVFVEIGPQPILSAMALMNNEGHHKSQTLISLPSMKKGEDEWQTFLTSLGKLYLQKSHNFLNFDINWRGLDLFRKRRIVSLPNYPFITSKSLKKFWPDMTTSKVNSIHPLLGHPMPNATPTKIFQQSLSQKTAEYFKDHIIGHRIIFPGAGYLEMSLCAGWVAVEGHSQGQRSPNHPMKIENLEILAPLEIMESRSKVIQTVVEEVNANAGTEDDMDFGVKVKIFQKIDKEDETNPDGSRGSSSWLSHASATFSPVTSTAEVAIPPDTETHFQEAMASSDSEGDNEATKLIEDVYDKLGTIGLKFGPAFRSIERIWRLGTNRLLAKVKSTGRSEGIDAGQQGHQYIVHPVTLDAMIQSIMMLKLRSSQNLKKKLIVPIKIGKFIWLSSNNDQTTFSDGNHQDDVLSDDLYIYAYDTSKGDQDSEDVTFNLYNTRSCTAVLLDHRGNPMALMTSVEFIDTTVKVIESILDNQTTKLPDLWEEVWRPRMGTTQRRLDLRLCNTTEIIDPLELEKLRMEHNLNLDSKEFQLFQKLEKFCYLHMLKALYHCGWSPSSKVKGHQEVFDEDALFGELQIAPNFRKLFTHYMKVLRIEGHLQKVGDGQSWKLVKALPTRSEVDELLSLDIMGSNNSAILLFSEVGQRLGNILRGEESVLQILFPESQGQVDDGSGSDVGSKNKKYPSVAEFYADYGKMFRLVESLLHVSSRYLQICKDYDKRSKVTGKPFVWRMLEVGAGTGNFTQRALEQVTDLGIQVEFTYTDISAAFFPAAEKNFKNYVDQGLLIFKKLNIEEDPVSQGFMPEYYDFICASDVIHATKDIKRSLQNIRTLLKPMGRLDIYEVTKVNRPLTFLFGLLDGFWHFEDFELRRDHCTITVDKWLNVFRDTGFDIVGSHQTLNDNHSYFCTNKSDRDPSTLTSKPEVEPGPSKLWILFHQPENPVSEWLQQKIKTVRGRKVITVTSGSDLDFDMENFKVRIRKNIQGDFIDLLKKIKHLEDSQVEGIVYCWSLLPDVNFDLLIQPYFNLLKALTSKDVSLAKGSVNLPRIITLTRSSTAPLLDSCDLDLRNISACTIWGVTRSFRGEQHEVQCRSIDIPESDSDDSLIQIFYELWNTSVKEPQVTFDRDGAAYHPKLISLKPTSMTSDLRIPSGSGDRFQLILPETNAINDLSFGPLEHFGDLEEHEVEVQVKASALNFKDVLNVIKPTEDFKNSNSVGFDYSGVIRRVGSKVTQWKPGDSVFGVNHGNLALPSHVKQHQDEILRIPESLTFPEASTLPAVFSTAYHCLIEVARITPDDTILVHTASGGVGLAAIQICQKVGVPMSRIFCTAGSSRKRNYLKNVVGVTHVFHSRNTDYSQKIMEVTKGQGVTVVLNSLTGEGFKEATLKVCAAKNGNRRARFVEMSKLNIWTTEEVNNLRPDVLYSVIDLSTMDRSNLRDLLTSVRDYLPNVKPIPYVRFEATGIRDALRYLQKARHIGKVVCVMPEIKGQRSITSTPLFHDRGTYLITGGLGGIGFTVCKWMVTEHGARYIILAGRSPPGLKVAEEINKMNREFGTNIRAAQLDVGDLEQCRKLIDESMTPPLKGVLHCAGTLSDGMIENLEWSKFSIPFRAKVTGTLNLHEVTKNLQLENFILFSSGASLIGPPAQSNHAAGNSFEDILAHFRYNQGLPATAINWGQWGQVGVAAELDLPASRPISTHGGLQALEWCMRSQPHRTQTAVINFESIILLTKLFPHFGPIMEEELQKLQEASGPGGKFRHSLVINSEEFWSKYDAIGSEEVEGQLEKKLQLIKDSLRDLLRSVLKMDDTEVIDEDVDLHDLGVDSLMFVELKNALQTLMGERVSVNASALRDCNTVRSLAETITKLIEGQRSLTPSREEISKLILEDCQLSDDIRAGDALMMSGLHVVLLTGATGTLGIHVLKELLKVHQVTEVICLLRGQDSNTILQNILQGTDMAAGVSHKSPKARVVTGNITEPCLGLEESEWAELCDKVDGVFHCAAKVPGINDLELEHYQKLTSESQDDTRSVNIQGLKNILEFCVRGSKLKRLCAISSLTSVTSVENFNDENFKLSEKWPEVEDYDLTTSLAYPITKFCQEVILREAVLNRGIPAKVIRLPVLSGDSKTGRWASTKQKNPIIEKYLQASTTPMTSDLSDSEYELPINFLPVDISARASVHIFFDDLCHSDIYNVCHGQALDLKDPDFLDGVNLNGVQENNQNETGGSNSENQTETKKLILDMLTTIPAQLKIKVQPEEVNEVEVELTDNDHLSNKKLHDFFKSPKITQVMPHFYDDLEQPIEYFLRDFAFFTNNTVETNKQK